MEPDTFWFNDENKLAIVKQLAAKMTSFGFPNDPHAAKCAGFWPLTPAVQVVRVEKIVGAPAFALVVLKDHKPVPAAHVVDFRIGGNIYMPAALPSEDA